MVTSGGLTLEQYVAGEWHFWSKVEQKLDPSECWSYTGAADAKAKYGLHSFGGHADRAHRVSYVLSRMTLIPSGFVVRHSCDNRICVNPTHLSLGTIRDNIHDAIKRDRFAKKLTWAEADTIRNSDEQSIVLARRYGISAGMVRKIRSGKSWARTP